MEVWLRRLALVLLVGVLIFAAVTARVLTLGEESLQASEEAFDAGELRDAIVHARRAATAYVPGAPHVDAAYDRLIAIAVGAETTHQTPIARQAWTAVRAAALETRHLWIHRASDFERANENLARLARSGEGMERRGEPPHGREELALLLSRDEAPRGRWVLLLAAGFLLSAVGLGTIAVRGVDAEGRFAAAPVGWGIVLTLVGLACWTIAVYRA